MPENSREKAKERFCKCGLRCTRQRETIYRALAATESHPTAEELYKLVRGADEGLSLATVYNALEAFCDRGIARRLATTCGPSRYDADVSEHLHVQDSDGKIHDVPRDLSDQFYDSVGADLMSRIADAMGMDIAGARIELAARAKRD